MVMESELGFMEATNVDSITEDNSRGYKLVPWINWDDWTFVRESLFSSSPDSISSALRRISAWRSRGCVPVVIEITASIIEIRQKDCFFRNDLVESSLQSEDVLTMLYCMTIIRLVNCIVEKTRKRNEVSIAEAADEIGIPRMLIDIRHECSHRDLPSLRLARVASTKALEWLKSNYWEPQRMAIPYPSDRTANLRKDVKSTLRGLAFGLDIKQTTQTSSSPTKRKRAKRFESLCGRNKFLSLVPLKLQSSKPAGSQKQITKALKRFVQLYSSSSSEVLSLLVESLLKALDPLDLALLSNSSQVNDNARRFQTLVDDWKPIIMKVSNKEPEILLNLLKTVLMMETQETLIYESGGKQSTSEGNVSAHQIEQLSCLFEWLVDNLKELNHVRHKTSAAEVDGSMKEGKFSKSALINLLYKCLLVSSPHNNNLTAASLKLARMVGNNTLFEKINKLTALHTSNIENEEESPPSTSYETLLSGQEATISQAAKKLEFLTQELAKKNPLETTEGGNMRKERWNVAKSWNSCPIGMLPSEIGSSGRLPILDSTNGHDEPSKLSENMGECELNQHLGKREAECSVEDLDDSEIKKMKESGGNGEEDTVLDGIKGRLMIGGVWKCVTEEEVDAISSSVRILV